MVDKSSTNRGRVRAARAKAAEKYRQRRLQRGIWPKGNPWLTQVESSFIQVNYWIIWIRTKVSVGQNHCESIYCFLFSVLPSLFFTFHLISPLILIYIYFPFLILLRFIFDAEWQVHDGKMPKSNTYEHDNIKCTWGKHDKQMRMTFSHNWRMKKCKW